VFTIDCKKTTKKFKYFQYL